MRWTVFSGIFFLLACVTATAQLRLEFEARWRLAEGQLGQSQRTTVQGRFVSLADSYFILDPVVTVGWSFETGVLRSGVALRGTFPHPMAGEPRLWPLAWAEVDLGWFGAHFDTGLGALALPEGAPARWMGVLVPELGFYLGTPAWSPLEGSVQFQPRLTASVRGFFDPSGPELRPFTAGLGLGLVSRF